MPRRRKLNLPPRINPEPPRRPVPEAPEVERTDDDPGSVQTFDPVPPPPPPPPPPPSPPEVGG